MKSKQRLGRGLGALLPADKEELNGNDSVGSNLNMMEIEVQSIVPNPFQPRLEFDSQALEELKESIKSQGIIQPISVRKLENGKYQLLAGERRLRALKELGIPKVPAYIMDVESDEDMLEIALIENVQREYLNPIETALGYQRLIEECNLTQEEVAKKIGKDRTSITNSLRLLKLPKVIQESIQKREIMMGHARALLSLQNEQKMIQLWKKTIAKNYSVRQVEREVKLMLQENEQKTQNIPERNRAKNIYFNKFEKKLREQLGTKVKIKPKREGGAIEIEFYSKEDLQRLMELFDEIKTI
ncbi:MAG: ParB/RepB/Spo0J family partition protein [Calditrichia bacterium]